MFRLGVVVLPITQSVIPFAVTLQFISKCNAEIFFADTLSVLNSQHLTNCFTSAGESFSCDTRTA
jgi:hypothetical protein